MIVLSAVMAFLVLAISLFLNSFYSYRSTGYEPKDSSRGELLEREQGGETSP